MMSEQQKQPDKLILGWNEAVPEGYLCAGCDDSTGVMVVVRRDENQVKDNGQEMKPCPV
jgi:hypothetical protein